MDFTFTEEQQMMAGAFRELAADICAAEQLRALYDGRDTQADARWVRLAEMGLFGVLAAEADGGMGLGDADFVLLAEEAGRCALPEPLVEQAGVAVPGLREVAAVPAVAAVLPRLAAGTARIAVVHPSNPYACVPPGLTHWLACDTHAVYLLEASAGGKPARNLPSMPGGACRARSRYPAAPNPLRAMPPRQRWPSGCSTAARSTAPRSAWGLPSACSSISVDYAKQRQQFGKAIGSYQAIKHHLATVAVKLEFCTRRGVCGRRTRRRPGCALAGGRLAREARRGGRRRAGRAHRHPGARRDGLLVGSRPALLHEARLGARLGLGRPQLPRAAVYRRSSARKPSRSGRTRHSNELPKGFQ